MISCLDNVFDDKLVNELWEKYKKFPFSYYWKSNHDSDQRHWNYSILKYDAKNDKDIENEFVGIKSDHDLEYAVWQKIKRLESNCRLLRIYVNAYTYGNDPLPHTDSKRTGEKTYILYINKDWKLEWGGETVIFNESQTDIDKSYLPKYNRLISFPSNRLHVARPIHRTCNELRIVLVIKIGTKNDIFYYLKSTTQNIPHSSRTLFDHLYGTYNILLKENRPEHICLAGLFHSIYGTNKFKHICETDRNKIIELIGKEAENLVWLFCNAPNRPNWDNSGISITEKEKTELKIIERANLKEQID